jgi:hypothetical protein
MQSSPASCHFLPLRSTYSPQHPVLKHPQCFLPLVWETNFPRPSVTFRNKLEFYGEELLAPRPNPKLEDNPLSAVR